MAGLNRRWLASAALASGIGGVLAWQVGAADVPAGQVTTIPVVAQRFHYTPGEIVVKRGQTTVLAFTALDFVHGFKVPDLGLRVDLPPGQITKVTLHPDKTGTYDFLCDNFCGAGHEEMNGKIIVVD